MSEVESIRRIREPGDRCTIVTPSYELPVVCTSVRQPPLEVSMTIFNGEYALGTITYQPSYYMSWEVCIMDRYVPDLMCDGTAHRIDEQYRCSEYTSLMKYLHYKLEIL